MEVVDLAQEKLSIAKARFETSFLGMSAFYWLRNVSELDLKCRRELLSYLQSYHGPNTLAFFSLCKDVSPFEDFSFDVMLPEEVKKQEFLSVSKELCGMSSAFAQQFAHAVLKRSDKITLDEACLLCRYGMVLSAKNVTLFIDEWLDHLLEPRASLFTLSKHFFAKEARDFFHLWRAVSERYPLQFWTIFWSEQLWRASAYVKLVRRNQRAEAKKISYKLPFAFLQHGWRNYGVRELKQAHDFVYTIDYDLKNGASPYGFDCFFSKFFQQQFS